MLQRIYKSTATKYLAVLLALSFLLDIVQPQAAMALTGGPSQPAGESFEPIGTSEMVDVFSGDFNYNIPLIDIGGYPINLAYHGGIGMDQEASWVGLGWNINPGVITRNMRGIPDEFNGETITKEFNMKPTEDYGVTINPGLELFGFDPKQITPTYTLGVNYNNYRGVNISQTVGLQAQIAKNKSGNTANRSEEHTSELQSPDHLVCRLLLEKKKQEKRK